jgi:hypothetical protein
VNIIVVKKTFVAFLSFLFLFLLTQSCQKIDATSIGGNLIPPVDNVNTFDTTLDVITDVNFLFDSTGVTYADEHALGVMDDPEFGRTSANIYFEVLPSTIGSYPFLPRDSIQGRIDSVILSLTYTGLYGDSNSVENLTVYEIAQTAVLNDSLYQVTGQDLPVAGALSQPITVNFTTLNDPKLVRPGKDTAVSVPNVLRIPLNTSFGQRLVNYDTSNAYKSDTVFRTYFKGLAIKADTNTSPLKKALAYFNLTAATTRLYVYYRANAGAKLDTAFAEFSFSSSRSGRKNANIIKRNTTGTNYAANVGNPSKVQDRLYIQSAPGSYASVYIPGLKGLTNRVVHKAELIAPTISSAGDNNFRTPLLFLDLIDSANSRFKTVQNDFMGDRTNGTYNITSFGGVIKGDEYRFDLSRYVQGIVTRKDTVYSLRLSAPFYTFTNYSIPNVNPPVATPISFPFLVNTRIAAGRVILAGGSHPTNRMRLRIIYSKI